MSQAIWIGTSTGHEGDWSYAANWSTASVPVDGDDVYLTNSSQSVTGGLNQSTVEPATLTIDSSYTGLIGTATSYLQIGAVILNIGTTDAGGSGIGSGRLNIDSGADPSTVNIFTTASQATDSGQSPVRLIGSNITALNVFSGKVAVAPVKTETATITTVAISGQTPTVFLGQGVTATTVDISSGNLSSYSTHATTTVNIYGGTYTNYTTATTTTVSSNGGTYYHNGTGTITTLNVGGIVSFAKDVRAKTVTNCNVYSGGSLNINNGVPLGNVTFTNGIQLVRCNIANTSLDFGSNYKITLS